jgi:hypothetical protein
LVDQWPRKRAILGGTSPTAGQVTLAWAAAALMAWASRSAVNGGGGGATWLGSSAGRGGRPAQAQRRLVAQDPQELYEIAKRRDLPGRSKIGRDELARALGYK